ncbi:MT-A70 family methyltransferase [Nocardia wallacei]|uniref:MT-A70 family methyltransferase n=1 Tax=Nocardia wallacei TaxID=480035 RepID=UPI0024579124|nr:MT-A70 family methyltransferase [Nocardia wallacei]
MTIPNITRRYRTILADPPWMKHQIGSLGASAHYSLMPLERIMALPVADLAEDNAHLWLWVTNATLRDGYDVIDAWGFVPRSPLTWVKPRFHLGNYLRNATEHLLFGTRGRAPVNFKSQPTWMFAPIQEHSHKPEEQYAVIERISNGPYLELFARRPQPRWHAWGNEIDSDIEIPGFPVPSDRKRTTNICEASPLRRARRTHAEQQEGGDL